MINLEALKTKKGFASYHDLAEMFGVTRVTIHRWAKKGALPSPRWIGGLLGWDMDELRSDLKLKKEKPCEPQQSTE
jgi:predicted DNA-binding transcriptional regulator AlpA